jgi:hypothetical protein
MFCNPGQVHLRYNGGEVDSIFSMKKATATVVAAPKMSVTQSCKRQARRKNDIMLSPFLH